VIGKALKLGGAALAIWLGATNAWPAVSEAWKARQAAIEVSSSSNGMTAGEVTKKYQAALERRGVKSVTTADIETARDGDRWVVGASFEVAKRLYGTASLVYEFSVASDRRSLW